MHYTGASVLLLLLFCAAAAAAAAVAIVPIVQLLLQRSFETCASANWHRKRDKVEMVVHKRLLCNGENVL